MAAASTRFVLRFAGGRLILALVQTELRLRLRSPATWIAVAAFVAGFWLWLPSADGRAVNLSWEAADGRIQTPRFTSALTGLACAELAGLILPMLGFYLIAGSIRADARRGVGQILAATPLPSAAYLAGKVLAHTVYLTLLALVGIVAGSLAFAARGEGPYELLTILLPTLWIAVPVALVVAVLAVLFDVTPGLRGTGGWVLWFFFFSIFLLALPGISAARTGGGFGGGPGAHAPVYDPSGIVGLNQLLYASLPDVAAKSISAGHILMDNPPEVVDWRGIQLTTRFRWQRAGTLLQTLVPFALALLLFDRFDPSRRRRSAATLKPAPAGVSLAQVGTAVVQPQPALRRSLADLPNPTPTPSAVTALLAEVRLSFESLGRWRWALLALAILPAVAPHPIAATVFLAVLTAVLAGNGARESVHGALGIVRAQPGIPPSLVLWKVGAMAGAALLILTPALARRAFEDPTAAALGALGALSIGALAAACGALTGGAKLFAGLHVTAIYLALNGLRSTDATGLIAKTAAPLEGPPGAVVFGVIATGLVAVAMWRERRPT